MEQQFNTLIDSFLQNKIGIANDFLSSKLTEQLILEIESLADKALFRDARIGPKNEVSLNSIIRNDKIYWLDRSHHNLIENLFFDYIDEFISYLNRTCYTGITGYEFHYAMYQKGNFYKKHLDQFKLNKSRAYTMIFYLNKNWVQGDGGELCIHATNGIELISPLIGKSIFFKSNEIEHEVLLNHSTRLSITGWLRTD